MTAPIPVPTSALPSIHESALWSAVGAPNADGEPQRLEGIRRCLVAGARLDTSAPKAMPPMGPHPLNLLDRVVLFAPAAAVPDRLQLLFEHGMSPNTVLTGLAHCLVECRAKTNIDTIDSLQYEMGKTVHGRRLLVGQSTGVAPRCPALLNVLIAGAMSSPAEETAFWQEAVRRTVASGAEVRWLPDTISPLAALIEQRHHKKAETFLALGSLLLEAGASFDEPCSHIAAAPFLYLRGHYHHKKAPADLTAYIKDVCNPSIGFGEDEDILKTLKVLRSAGDLQRALPSSDRSKPRSRM